MIKIANFPFKDLLKTLSDGSRAVKVQQSGSIVSTRYVRDGGTVLPAGQSEIVLDIKKEIKIHELFFLGANGNARLKIDFWNGSSWEEYLGGGKTGYVRSGLAVGLFKSFDVTNTEYESEGEAITLRDTVTFNGIRIIRENTSADDLIVRVGCTYSEVAN